VRFIPRLRDWKTVKKSMLNLQLSKLTTLRLTASFARPKASPEREIKLTRKWKMQEKNYLSK